MTVQMGLEKQINEEVDRLICQQETTLPAPSRLSRMDLPEIKQMVLDRLLTLENQLLGVHSVLPKESRDAEMALQALVCALRSTQTRVLRIRI